MLFRLVLLGEKLVSKYKKIISKRLFINYLKQTGPISKPNSWFLPPISRVAMSKNGKRWGFSIGKSVNQALYTSDDQKVI